MSLSKTEQVDLVKYYENLESNLIKIGKYIIPKEVPTVTKEIKLSCKNFGTLVKERAWIDRLIIDAYNATRCKDCKTNITFITTDDTQTMIGDYTEKRTRQKTF